jgi:ABC-2 type transport system permease protein
MRGVVLMAVKDLRRAVRDRSALMIAIVAPLGLAFILGSLIGDADSQVFDVTYAVVNEDPGGELADTFVNEVLGGFEEETEATIRTPESEDAARRMVTGDDAAAAFIIPSGFTAEVQSGGSSTIEVLANRESPIATEIARSIAESYASDLNAVQLSVVTVIRSSGAPPDESEARSAAGLAAEMSSPITINDRVASKKQFQGNTFTAAGMAVFFLFFTTQMGAVSLLAERREGTLARLIAAPVSRGAIVASKALYTYVLGVVATTVLVVASVFLLGAEWGDPLGVALMILCGVFAAMGVESLVAALANTDEQAAGYGSIIAVTLGLLGGTFFPLSQAPEALATVSLITPHAWMMRGMGELSGGASTAADLGAPILALLLFGGITGAIALARSRHLVATR